MAALSGPLLSATNRTPGSWWFFQAHSYPQQIALPGLGGSFWPTLIRNKSYSRVLVARSGPFLFVKNRSPGSWWLFLAHSYLYQIVLPGLGGSFWRTLLRNISYSWPTLNRSRSKSYSRALVVLSGQLLTVEIVLPVLGGSFWPTLNRNKSYCRVLVALSGPFFSVTNRTPGSWWPCLAHSYP